MSFISDTVKLYIDSSNPYLYLVTQEEDRVFESVQKEVIGVQSKDKKLLNADKYKLYAWSFSNGMYHIGTSSPHTARMWPESRRHDIEQIPGTNNFNAALNQFLNQDMGAHGIIGILIAKDLPSFFAPNNKNPVFIRSMRDAMVAIATNNRIVIMTYPERVIPTELERTIRVVDVPLLSREELKYITEHSIIPNISNQVKLNPKKFSSLREDYTETEIWEIATAATGMTQFEFYSACNVSLSQEKEINPKRLNEGKQEIIKKSGALEYMEPNGSFDQVGGLENLKSYLEPRKDAYSQDAREFGVDPPRGIILLGYAGCGKSLVAKMLGGEWGLPVIRVDMGAIYGGLVGASEENIRAALKIIEAAAPCVAFIDEMEKAMAGVSSSNVTDGGTSARVFGTMLTWLQEKTAPVYVIGTCNDITQMKPELVRKGRFDEIFWVDLPGPTSVHQILEIHLAKRGFSVSKLDIDLSTLSQKRYVADNGKGYAYSGSEWEEAIRSSILTAYWDGKRNPNTDDIAQAIDATIPLGYLKREEMEASGKLWSKRARQASNDLPVLHAETASIDDLTSDSNVIGTREIQEEQTNDKKPVKETTD